jgi:hypothetical protein
MPQARPRGWLWLIDERGGTSPTMSTEPPRPPERSVARPEAPRASDQSGADPKQNAEDALSGIEDQLGSLKDQAAQAVEKLKSAASQRSQ